MWHQHHRSLQAACGASYRTFRPAGALSAKHTWVRIRTLQCPYYNLLVREMKVDGQLPLSGGNAGQERLERFRVVACSCGCHSKGEGRHLRVPTCVEPDPRDLCIVRLLIRAACGAFVVNGQLVNQLGGKNKPLSVREECGRKKEIEINMRA